MSRRDWRFTDETLTTAVRPAGGGRAIGRRKAPGEMNKTEEKFAGHLELRKQVGEILWWAFEGMTFRIGDRCYFTPDFDVLLSTCELVCIDVKGTQTKTRANGETYEAAYYEDDAKVKMVAAGTLYPISFRMVHLDANGNWIEKEIGS